MFLATIFVSLNLVTVSTFRTLDEIRDSAPLKWRLLPRRLLIFIFAPENTDSLYTRA